MKKFVVLIALIVVTCSSAHQYMEKEPKISLPSGISGRLYYDSLIEKASKRHWAISIGIHFATMDGGFNDNGCSVPLSTVVFGKDPITIKDIYLFSKLSDDNKVRINNCDARAPERGGVPIGGLGVVFGGFRDDLYTTLLAPVQLIFNAKQTELILITSGMYRFDIGRSELFSLAFGYSIPLKSKTHSLDYTYLGGDLFRPGFVPDTTQREHTLKQFFRDFVDVEDFINKAILKPKGLEFVNEQQKIGLGDIALFGLITYQGDWNLEAGLQVVFPSAAKAKGDKVWEPVLGNGGAIQFNPFAQVLMATSAPYLQPFLRLAAEISSAFKTDTLRVTTLVTNPSRTQVKNVAGLSAPETFQNFYVDSFSEFDTSVPLFADKTPCVQKKTGSKILFGIGNYAYKIFHIDLRWGLFYDYYHQSKDSVVNKANQDGDDGTVIIDEKSIERNTDQSAHIFGTNLTYKFYNMFELGAGAQFTFLGKNVAKNRIFYLSFVAVF